MKQAAVALLVVSLSTLAMLAGTTASATQDELAPAEQEVTQLKERIASAHQELAAEDDRTYELLRRLACTEELLEGYYACRTVHEAESPAYWACVQSALGTENECAEGP